MNDVDLTDPRAVVERIARLHVESAGRRKRLADLYAAQNAVDAEHDRLSEIALESLPDGTATVVSVYDPDSGWRKVVLLVSDDEIDVYDVIEPYLLASPPATNGTPYRVSPAGSLIRIDTPDLGGQP